MSERPRSFEHVFVPAKDAARPVLLALHGTGGDENDLVPFASSLLPGAAILSPRGQVLEHGMPRFFRRLAAGVFDEADLRARAEGLADFVAEAAAHYHFDAGRVIALGYSNGANVACAALFLRPGVFRGAALLRPMIPFEPAPLPDLAGTRIYLGAGTHDEMTSADQTEKLESMLRRAGAEVEAHRSRAGHALVSEDVAALREWMSSWSAT